MCTFIQVHDMHIHSSFVDFHFESVMWSILIWIDSVHACQVICKSAFDLKSVRNFLTCKFLLFKLDTVKVLYLLILVFVKILIIPEILNSFISYELVKLHMKFYISFGNWICGNKPLIFLFWEKVCLTKSLIGT